MHAGLLQAAPSETVMRMCGVFAVRINSPPPQIFIEGYRTKIEPDSTILFRN
jgi:hypothetical protein